MKVITWYGQRFVVLPLPGGKDVRKLLYDRADLDRLIERSKDPAAS